MTNKNSERVFGTKHKPDNGEVSKTQVTFWNLIRSYILLHYPDKIVAYVATGIDSCMDFLHYSYVHEFETVEEMDKFIQDTIDEYNDPDGYNGEDYVMYITSINGTIQKYKYE